MSDATNDPMAFLRNLWGNAGVPLPGLTVPILDVNELDKRIIDMKTVEGWLKLNLNMLQMNIQGLEMQRATLAALQAVSQPSTSAEASANPFANPDLWPWNLTQPGATFATEPPPDPEPKQSPKP